MRESQVQSIRPVALRSGVRYEYGTLPLPQVVAGLVPRGVGAGEGRVAAEINFHEGGEPSQAVSISTFA